MPVVALPERFIERASRASAQADLVIANHALVMVNAARGREAGNAPTRIVFDEGHHIAEAADYVCGRSYRTGGNRATPTDNGWRGVPADAGGGWRHALPMFRAMTKRVATRSLLQPTRQQHFLRTAGCSGLQRARRLAPLKRCSQPCAVRFTRAPMRRTPAMALKPNLQGLTDQQSQPSSQRLWHLMPGLVRSSSSGRRLEAVLDDAPDWLDGQARARIEGAIASLGWRRDALSAWLSMLSQAWRSGRSGLCRLACSRPDRGSRGRLGSIVIGSIRPDPSHRQCSSQPTAPS